LLVKEIPLSTREKAIAAEITCPWNLRRIVDVSVTAAALYKIKFGYS